VLSANANTTLSAKPVSFFTSLDLLTPANTAGQLCKAWVNFNGTTVTPSTIRASYNVSSITRTSQGNYTVNLTASLVDANAAVIATTAAMGFPSPTVTYASATASSCSVTVQGTSAGSGVFADAATVCVAVFR
jgi:hypothetical protein